MASDDLTTHGRAALATWLLTLHESLSVKELAAATGLGPSATRHMIRNFQSAGLPITRPARGRVALISDSAPASSPRPAGDPEMLRGYADVQTAADILNVHPETVRRRIRSGELPATKAGGAWLIDEEAL